MGTLSADEQYLKLLKQIHEQGIELETRNHLAKSFIHADKLIFDRTPLITVRRTAWKKAIREMEWFMSGETKCPEVLMDWWEGQLGQGNMYRGGYSNQFRASGSLGNHTFAFDQVKYVLEGLRKNPNSRRLIMTTWNPWDMAHITEINANPKVPTCCHNTITQFFVREKRLHLTTYQRSCDVLLGLPHNLIQTWALLCYFAHHAKLKVGTMQWVLGDAHVYREASHQATLQELLSSVVFAQVDNAPDLVYNPIQVFSKQVPDFKANDFEIAGIIPEPLCRIRPLLL